MSMKTTEISQILTRWLERFTPPVGIRGNPRAAQDAADALLRALLRSAPQADYAPWVRDVLDRVEDQMKTRAWPTVAELSAACRTLRKDTPRGDAEPVEVDRFELAARRIRAKQPVGDEWIYGRDAHEIVARGLVSEGDLAAYRSGLFFQLRSAWGEDCARAVEAEFRRRHELAGPGNGLVGAA